jgi:hypothetical protein
MKQENDLDVLQVGAGTNASAVLDSNVKHNRPQLQAQLDFMVNGTAFPTRGTKAYGGVRGIDPLFLNFFGAS